METELLQAHDLRKSFPGVDAVRGVSLSISAGTCFGLLGPNGAGKTTTVEMLEGILPPDSGEILFRGEPLSSRFREQAGIMFQSTALQDYITVAEALRMFASFYTNTLPEAELIEQCALAEFLDRDTRKLSGGQKQRLLLAIALVNDPAVLFLDEPTTGLDPQARRNFWDLVNAIKARGKTIILTTHYMEEAAVLCDELVFMDHGLVIAQGSPRELLSAGANDVKLELPLDIWPDDVAAHSAYRVVRHADRIELLTEDVNATLSHLLQLGLGMNDLRIRSRTLEDLFIELTGEALRA